jgi:hypothetical protein
MHFYFSTHVEVVRYMMKVSHSQLKCPNFNKNIWDHIHMYMNILSQYISILISVFHYHTKLTSKYTFRTAAMFYTYYYYNQRNRGSSVSTVSGYALDDRAIGVRSLAESKDFSSSLCVQTGSGAHHASCTMGIGVPFPGQSAGRDVTLTTHPYLVPRSWMSRSYTTSPPQAPPCRVAELLYFFTFIVLTKVICFAKLY